MERVIIVVSHYWPLTCPDFSKAIFRQLMRQHAGKVR